MDPLLSLVTNQLVESFPDPKTALNEPDGLLAAGGDLTVETLLEAYAQGIFPWFSDGQPILWWSPNQRSILQPGRVKISRSLNKTIRNGGFRVSIDQAFAAVIAACAAPRPSQTETWITPSMQKAYIQLFKNGHAHSIECTYQGQLVGGLYGVSIGGAFFGESMFSTMRDASKVALVALSDKLHAWNYTLIDCQLHSAHLVRMGAEQISRADFLQRLAEALTVSPHASAWVRYDTGQQ